MAISAAFIRNGSFWPSNYPNSACNVVRPSSFSGTTATFLYFNRYQYTSTDKFYAWAIVPKGAVTWTNGTIRISKDGIGYVATPTDAIAAMWIASRSDTGFVDLTSTNPYKYAFFDKDGLPTQTTCLTSQSYDGTGEIPWAFSMFEGTYAMGFCEYNTNVNGNNGSTYRGSNYIYFYNPSDSAARTMSYSICRIS